MNIFVYVTAEESSAAPNFSGPSATFAIGQPEIRRQAQPGDVVLGCTGISAELPANAVRWAGRVTEKLSTAQYWDDPRFRSKRPGLTVSPDNIYRWSDRSAGDLEQIHGNGVRDARHIVADLGGRFVLVFAEYWDLSSPYPMLPRGFDLELPEFAAERPLMQEFSRQQWWEMREWLCRHPVRPTHMPAPAAFAVARAPERGLNEPGLREPTFRQLQLT